MSDEQSAVLSDNYTTVAGRATAEFTERRSRFLSAIEPIRSEAEAQARIAAVNKEYWDARHTVYAYVLRDGQIRRYSDDGEPQGTAGLPVLEVLERQGLTDCLITVTRYFCGILLGTGGRYRAYSGAAAEALSDAGSVVMRKYALMSAAFGYDEWARTEKSLRTDICRIIGCDYSSSVAVSAAVPPEGAERFRALVSDITCGRSSPAVSGYRYYRFTE